MSRTNEACSLKSDRRWPYRLEHTNTSSTLASSHTHTMPKPVSLSSFQFMVHALQSSVRSTFNF